MQNFSVKNAPLDMDKWREIVEAWNKSGESQKVYCQRLGVSLNTFSYARSKLLKQKKSKAPFIPLAVKSSHEEKTLAPSVIVLENPHGYKLRLSASLSLEQLTKLFKLSGWNNAEISIRYENLCEYTAHRCQKKYRRIVCLGTESFCG